MDMYGRVRELTETVEQLQERVAQLEAVGNLSPDEFVALRAAEAVEAVHQADVALLAEYAAAEKAAPKPRATVLDALRERGVEV